jgi:F0F1-type ATP synthase epsilon subunit
VTIPTEVGEVGILADHCDYVGLLSTGLATYEVVAAGARDALAKKCLVSGGIATFSNNTLTLLADTVDNPDSLDTAPLSEDLTLLKAELEALSLFEPEWEALSQKIARIEALKQLVAASAN